jgi:MarR family transcriptional regulator, organic hydroperoxide resistance regulator
MQISLREGKRIRLVSPRNCCSETDDKPLYRLTYAFPYLLNRVGVRMGELFSRRIAGYDVSLPMYRVMAALWETPDQRLGDLAAMTSIEVSTLSRLIGTMKRKGLVSRTRLKDNARTVAINLTAKGKTLVEELIPIAMHFEDVAVRSFSSKEIAELKTTLSNIYDNLDTLEPEIRDANAKASAKANGAKAGSARR